MKKKAIDKIPYFGLKKTSRKKDVKYIGVTAVKIVGHEKHLFLEVYRNKKESKEIPMVRIVLTKKDFGTYWPEKEEWTRQKIKPDSCYGRVIWGEEHPTWEQEKKENILQSTEDLERIKKFCKANVYNEEHWWEYIYKHEDDIVITARRNREHKAYMRRQEALADRMAHTKELPEKEILDRADRLYFHNQHYLYYKKHGCWAHIACSKCGGVTDARWKSGISYESQFQRWTEEPREGHYGTCPMCGARGEYKCQGKVKGTHGKYIYLFLGQKYKENGMVMRYVEVGKKWTLGFICGDKGPEMYNAMITYMHKLGGHYCGTTSWDLFYRQLMMIIKYATTHSQSIMAGCTSYSNQNQNLVEETGVMRVVLTKAQAAGYVIGSYVSIGDVGSNTNKDRYYSYMHNKAYSVKVTKIEDVDDSNAAVYVDAPEAFDTTLTTWITTMPWHSGATDEVAGSDGSPNSNTNGKDPYKIQGIETCIGAYEVLGNVVMDIVTGPDGNPARDVYVCEDASTLSSNIATVRANYKKAIAQVAYTAASWKYITEETTDTNLGIMIPTKVGGGSTTGFADGLYTDAGTSGQREWLALGYLNLGALAGLWILYANYGWSYAYWNIVSGVSPNGTRGEWQATA